MHANCSVWRKPATSKIQQSIVNYACEGGIDKKFENDG